MLTAYNGAIFASTAAVFIMSATASAQSNAQLRQFSIDAQSAQTAISQLGRQGDVQVIASRKLTRSVRTNAVHGEFTVEAAISRLLDGTGLAARQTGARTYAIVARSISAVPQPAMALADQNGDDNGPPTRSAPPQRAAPSPFATSTDDQILVTARRREERLIDVPIAITAFREQDLRNRSIKSATDLTTAVPGLQIQFGAASRNTLLYVIRGQNSTVTGDAGALPYFAEVPMDGFDPQFFDIENVQVLKGPQGVSFGKNSTGGAVLVTPVKPKDQLGGYLRAELGQYHNRLFEGAINIPIVADKVLLRIAGQDRERHGFTRNLFDGSDLDGINRSAVRATLLLRPWDSFENVTVYSRTKRDERSSLVLSSLSAVTPARATVSGAQCPCANPFYPVFAPYLAAQQARGPRVVDLSSADNVYFKGEFVVNTTTWTLNDSLTLKNIFGYLNKANYLVSDLDGTPLFFQDVFVPPTGAPRTKQVSEELQLQGHSFDGKLDWIVGGFYQRVWNPRFEPTYYIQGTISLLPAFPASLAPLPPSAVPSYFGTQLTIWQQVKSVTKAGYASGTYKFDNGLSLSAGLRYTHDEKSQDSGNSFSFGAYSINSTGIGSSYIQAPAVVPLNTSRPTTITSTFIASSATTWNLAAEYKFNDRTMIYATTRRGYKAGGINSGASAQSGFATFAPEKLQDYEIGLKSRWDLGGLSGTANLALFRGDYSDIQRQSSTILPSGVITVVTGNSASAVIQGVEFEGRVDFNRWLSVSGFYSYTDAYYKKWTTQSAYMFPSPGAALAPGTVSFDFSGNSLASSPRTKWSIMPQATFPLGDFGRLLVTVPINHVGSQVVSDFATLDGPDTTLKAYTSVDLRIGLSEIAGSRFSLALAVTNLTDKTYAQGAIGDAGGLGSVRTVFAPPRMWSLEAQYEF